MGDQGENEFNTDNESSQSDSDYEIEISSKPHKCTFDSCKKSFDRPNRLASHMWRHTQERCFKCGYSNCEKAFYSRHHLRRHQLKFHLKQIENAMCPIEGCLQVMRKNSLQKHILRKHNSLRKYKFQCEECGKGAKSEAELKQHSNEHTNVFRCDICDKVFEKGYRYNAHLKIHEKEYECDCKQLFLDFESFTQHKKICITKKSEHRCKLCDKVFSTKFNLGEHQKTHLHSEPTFECDYEGCGRKYRQRKNLTQHIRKFHFKSNDDNTSLMCDICEKIFKNRKCLRRHLKKFHENPVPPTEKVRKTRRDKGIPKIPMITVLTGLKYPEESEDRKIIYGETLGEQSNLMEDFVIGGQEVVPKIEN